MIILKKFVILLLFLRRFPTQRYEIEGSRPSPSPPYSPYPQVAVSTGVAEECLGNIRTVRSFASEEHEADIFATEVDKSRALNEALGFGIGLFQVIIGP